MLNYIELERQVIDFMRSSRISAYDLARIAENLCTCGTCRYYVQHYTKNGELVNFGHCNKTNIPKGKQPGTRSCGSWMRDRRKDE